MTAVSDSAQAQVELTEDCALTIRGCNLTEEETAALTAIMQATLAQAQQDCGPDPQHPDRTLDRRRRLGLWDRPGSGSWKNSAGWN